MHLKKFKWKDLGHLMKDTYNEWNEDDPWRMSAVIAYYAILSLPALLVICITIAGTFFGQEAVQGEISGQVKDMIGSEAAIQVETMIAQASESKNSIFATIVGVATLIFGATGVFFQLQKSLNEIWEVKPVPKQALKKLILDRAFSLGIVLVIAFLLLISLVVSAGLSALSTWISTKLPEYVLVVFQVLNVLLSFGVVTVLFAMIYKILPDAKIKWRDVWIGALVTALLFVLGKFLLGLYFGYSDPGSAYGAAGSVIVILVWVSYACLILFFGAEFTQVYARRYGGKIEPSDHAVRTADYYVNMEKREED